MTSPTTAISRAQEREVRATAALPDDSSGWVPADSTPVTVSLGIEGRASASLASREAVRRRLGMVRRRLGIVDTAALAMFAILNVFHERVGELGIVQIVVAPSTNRGSWSRWLDLKVLLRIVRHTARPGNV